MLERFVSVVAGMALPFLLMAACSVALSGGTDHDRSGRGRHRRLAALLGLVTGAVFAILRSTAVLESRTTITLVTLTACVAVDLALVIMLARVARTTPRAGSDRRQPWQDAPDSTAHPRLLEVANYVACVAIALTFFRASPDVILQLASFIEPGETVASSTMMLRVLGFLLGWGAVWLVAYVFRRAGALAPQRVFGWTAVTLAALTALVHLTSLLQLLHAAHRIQLSGAAFRFLAWAVNSQSFAVILASALLLVPLLLAAAHTLRERPLAENPAQERLAQASATHTRRWVLASAAGFALVTLTLTVGAKQLDQKVTLSEPEPFTLREGRASIPVTSVEDGHLHRYAYTAADGTAMRFIIVRKSGGAYGVALDACESCGPVGYFERDGKIICKACDVAINLATIGFRGGCNPIPVDFVVSLGAIEIETTTLDSLASVFA